MDKNIKNITEELMMKYVEGDMNSEESKKFERILSQNEYLNTRVSTLKQMADSQPLKSPPESTHQKILSSLNISDKSQDFSYARKYSDYFMGIFERRPVLAGSVLTGIAATFLFFVFNPSDSNEGSIQSKQSDPSIAYEFEDLEKDKKDKLEWQKASDNK